MAPNIRCNDIEIKTNKVTEDRPGRLKINR